MHIIRLLHLSDLHLSLKRRRFRPSYCDPDCLEEVARIANKNAALDRIDGVIVSGDIADSGRTSDLAIAKDFLFPQELKGFQWITSKLKPSLNVYNKPIIFLPGNHDRFGFFDLVPGSKEFDKFFSGHWKGNDRGISFWCLPDDKNPQLMIICADFTIKSLRDCIFWIGQGKVYDDQLRELLNFTKKAKDKTPVIWVLHFAPDKQVGQENPVPFKLKLNDSRILVKKAEVFDIKYIFCGHIHKGTNYNAGISKKVMIHCAGSSTCPELNENPSINLIEIKIEGKNIDRVRVYPFEWNGETFV